ncbi:transposase InsO family protein [Parabacteroides sp. PF5-5]|uniref:integrase core domain-containing protein n=1 Tax=unclassified Parabacteroides TaxID=2649774 RepID=UPI002476429F|nr:MULTISPECIES: integrase core domain-containing protein [unclassified Parabacteroides]MDH6306286.1 transposase InsO family protein [Parabacteroides sp. PH5-39]MDH6316923.1 transposase InsO family protein [Parabacteroides sp. PF5-13]MDH6320992.1 transposase InsO family protein [Parabacteroides sp. PH5-13]MDH6324724.1 transposase InsO family protein [Parabacteroides sp. PH5-8]MDH6328108.1 transposase InsO family protein [Parabacteroides sp. PH5-41]
MSKAYVKLLKTAGMLVSVTQNGDPYENALADRVNGILKGEWINQESYDNFQIAQKRIHEIIRIYNCKRLHSAIGYRTPEEVHRRSYKVKRATRKQASHTTG